MATFLFRCYLSIAKQYIYISCFCLACQLILIHLAIRKLSSGSNIMKEIKIISIGNSVIIICAELRIYTNK